jgi:hypothetical protein
VKQLVRDDEQAEVDAVLAELQARDRDAATVFTETFRERLSIARGRRQ